MNIHSAIIESSGLNMKSWERMTTLFVAILILLYFLFCAKNVYVRQDWNKPFKPPLPDEHQLHVVFERISELSGKETATVNIVENGKYAFPNETFTFDYQERPESLEVLNRVMTLAKTTAKRKGRSKWNGYVKIHHFNEELSKEMLKFVRLGDTPGFQDKKMVAPRFENGNLGSIYSTPFGVFYNLNELNRLYANNDYPPIVSEEEYESVCEQYPETPIYVIKFIKPNKGWLPDIEEKLYSSKGKGEQWMDCNFLNKSIPAVTAKLHSVKRKILCATWNFDISNLSQKVLHTTAQPKCFEVLRWGDHRTSGELGHDRRDRLSPNEIFQYVLHPSDMILNEAKTFMKRNLERPYVAIHIRSGHIDILPSTVDRCYQIAMKIVATLKKKRGVKSIYLSTDMTVYGSRGSHEPGHEEYLAAISGAVLYNPNATGQLTKISRTSVALTNVALLSNSDHLIAIGTGSFHHHVIQQFLKEHYGVDPKLWSVIRMCENARG